MRPYYLHLTLTKSSIEIKLAPQGSKPSVTGATTPQGTTVALIGPIFMSQLSELSFQIILRLRVCVIYAIICCWFGKAPSSLYSLSPRTNASCSR